MFLPFSYACKMPAATQPRPPVIETFRNVFSSSMNTKAHLYSTRWWTNPLWQPRDH